MWVQSRLRLSALASPKYARVRDVQTNSIVDQRYPTAAMTDIAPLSFDLPSFRRKNSEVILSGGSESRDGPGCCGRRSTDSGCTCGDVRNGNIRRLCDGVRTSTSRQRSDRLPHGTSHPRPSTRSTTRDAHNSGPPAQFRTPNHSRSCMCGSCGRSI
jgi:hypothetical protein